MSPKMRLIVRMLNSGQDYQGREHDREYVRRELEPRLACLREISARAPHLLVDDPIIGRLSRDALVLAQALDAKVAA